MIGTVKMCVDGFEFQIASTFAMEFGHTGYIAFTGGEYKRNNARSYSRDNHNFYGPKGFDESRALNFIANDYVEYLKSLGKRYNND